MGELSERPLGRPLPQAATPLGLPVRDLMPGRLIEPSRAAPWAVRRRAGCLIHTRHPLSGGWLPAPVHGGRPDRGNDRCSPYPGTQPVIADPVSTDTPADRHT